MKKVAKILRYVIPYWVNAAFSILFNLLSTFFSLFSMVMIIPFLQVLFKLSDTVVEKPESSFSIEYVTDYFDYYLGTLIETNGSVYALIFVCILVIIMTFFKSLFRYASLYLLAPVRNGSLRDIRNTLFKKILELPLSYYSDARKGDVISRMTNDVQEIEVSIMRSLEMLFRDPIQIIVYLIALLYMSPQLTMFALILLPLSGLIIGRVGKGLRSTALKGQKKLGSILSVLEETLSGLRIIKAFNTEDKTEGRFKSVNSLYTRLMIKMWRRRDLANPLSEFLGTVVIVIIMWYGGSLVLEDMANNTSKMLSAQSFIGYIIVFSQIITPAKSFSNAYYNILKGIASIDRIEVILNAINPIKEKEDASEIKEFNHTIEYKNVHFKYETEEVLKGIDLKIEKGKTIALVGQSGSGKSTLVDLLPRFYNLASGDILIDGKSINDYKISDLRGLMGNVNQEAILFNDSIFNNIAFGVQNVSIDRVMEAAKVANAHEFIENTDRGYYTNIGDRGGKLSGGQRQRLSIARAVLKNPPIMILDEATSALDTESERLVQDALEKLMENRTSIVIAHRLSTVIHADEICVMQEGKIVERGKHKELMELGGYYKRLHDMQMFA